MNARTRYWCYSIPHPHITLPQNRGKHRKKRHIFEFKAAEHRTERTNTPDCIENVSDDERFSPNEGIFNITLQCGVVMQKDHKTSL